MCVCVCVCKWKKTKPQLFYHYEFIPTRLFISRLVRWLTYSGGGSKISNYRFPFKYIKKKRKKKGKRRKRKRERKGKKKETGEFSSIYVSDIIAPCISFFYIHPERHNNSHTSSTPIGFYEISHIFYIRIVHSHCLLDTYWILMIIYIYIYIYSSLCRRVNMAA